MARHTAAPDPASSPSPAPSGGSPPPRRESLRTARRRVRRRLRTPPPAQLQPGPDPDGGRSPSSARLRRRVLAGFAALPLIVAVTLLIGGDRPAGTASPDAALSSPEASSELSTTAPTAAVARAESTPLWGSAAVPSAHRPPADTAASSPESAEAPVAAEAVPTPQEGQRMVVIRPADPAAASLVAAGDRVDVVGLDGTVLAAQAEVLQVRSAGAGPVLVVAVPEEVSAAVAAAVVSVEVTVVLSPGKTTPSAADAAPAATDPAP